MKKLIRKLVIWAFRTVEIQTSLTHGGRITVIKEIENDKIDKR